MAVCAVVSSLQNCCLRAVVVQLSEHESSLQFLPLELKTKLVHLMSKRGLLSDGNLSKVSCECIYLCLIALSGLRTSELSSLLGLTFVSHRTGLE